MVRGEGHAHASAGVTADAATPEPRGRRRWNIVVLWIAVGVFAALQAATITDGHNWGDDFSQYIRHATNLLEGRDYRHGIWMDRSIFASEVGQTYPIGFPALIAPLVLLFGVNFPVLKAVNIIFWALWVLVMHRMVRCRAGDVVALWVSLFLLSSPWFFEFKQNVLSDVPFLFFTTLALALYEDYSGDGSPYDRLRFAATLAAAAAALLIRSAGLALFVALFIHLACCRRAPGPALAALALPVLIRVFEWGLDIHDSGYSGKFAYPWQGLTAFARTVMDQTIYSFVMLGKLYVPYRFPSQLYYPVVAFLAAMLAVILALRLAKLQVLRGPGWLARIELIDVFFAVYLGMVVLYPHKQGPRFLLPLAGIALIYAVDALMEMVRYIGHPRRVGTVATVVLAAGVIHNAVATAFVWKFDDDHIHRPQTVELMTWIRDTIREDEHFIFHYARAAALFTNRTGKFLPERPEAVLEECRERRIRWVILSENWESELIDRFRSSPEVREIWHNEEFHAFEVLPAAAQPGEGSARSSVACPFAYESVSVHSGEEIVFQDAPDRVEAVLARDFLAVGIRPA